MKFSLLTQKIWLAVSFTLICLVSCSAQTLLTEISTEVNYTETLRVMLSGDSMLFVYPKPGYSSYRSGDELKSVWISGSGSMRELNLPLTSNRSLMTFVREGKKEKYYFLESENKKNFLTCLTVDVEAGTDTWEDGKLEVPGLLLGYFFSGDLYLVCTKPTESILQVLQVKNDLIVKEEKRFAFPFPLLPKKRTSVAFLNEGVPITPAEAMAEVKIYRRDSLLLISVDEQFDQFDENQNYPKTTIHQLNMKSGRYSNRHIVETSKNFFRSIIFDDHLYRLVGTREALLQIYNLKTSQEKIINLSTVSDDPNVFAYWVDEEDNEIRTTKYKKIIPVLNYVTPDTVSSEVKLRIGTRYATRTTVPVLYPFGLAGALVSMASNIVLMSLPATPAIDKHFYLEGSPDKGFRFTSNSGLIRQSVSDYDLKMARENYKRYKYKHHVYGRDLAYGFYLEYRSDKVKIIKFQQARSAEK